MWKKGRGFLSLFPHVDKNMLFTLNVKLTFYTTFYSDFSSDAFTYSSNSSVFLTGNFNKRVNAKPAATAVR